MGNNIVINFHGYVKSNMKVIPANEKKNPGKTTKLLESQEGITTSAKRAGV